MWNDGEMIQNIDKGNVQLWLWSSTQHNIFTESIGYAVAIETIHILRCVWKASHTHTCGRTVNGSSQSFIHCMR